MDEISYLCSLHFLTASSAGEIIQYRAASAALDALLAELVAQGGSNCDEVENDSSSALYSSSASSVEEEELNERIAATELEMRQLRSSVCDQINVALSAVLEVQVTYAQQRRALLHAHATSTTQGSTGSASATAYSANKLFDLLQGPEVSVYVGLSSLPLVNLHLHTLAIFFSFYVSAGPGGACGAGLSPAPHQPLSDKWQ